jgi:hypothetical protein
MITRIFTAINGILITVCTDETMFINLEVADSSDWPNAGCELERSTVWSVSMVSLGHKFWHNVRLLRNLSSLRTAMALISNRITIWALDKASRE